jgi:hypothetical protein
VSADPSTPPLVHEACLTLWLGAAGRAKAGFGSATIPLDILKRVIQVGVANRRAQDHLSRARLDTTIRPGQARAGRSDEDLITGCASTSLHTCLGVKPVVAYPEHSAARSGPVNARTVED